AGAGGVVDRGAVGPGGADGAVRGFRGRGRRGEPPALWARSLCVHQVGKDRGGGRSRGRKRHGGDQQRRARVARGAVRRRERFRLRLGGRGGGDRGGVWY